MTWDRKRKRQQVMDVNVNGVLFTAQAAGRQMARFGNGGSIVLIASMSGSITNKVRLLARSYVRPPACLVFWGRASSGAMSCARSGRAGPGPDPRLGIWLYLRQRAWDCLLLLRSCCEIDVHRRRWRPTSYPSSSSSQSISPIFQSLHEDLRLNFDIRICIRVPSGRAKVEFLSLLTANVDPFRSPPWCTGALVRIIVHAS